MNYMPQQPTHNPEPPKQFVDSLDSWEGDNEEFCIHCGTSVGKEFFLFGEKTTPRCHPCSEKEWRKYKAGRKEEAEGSPEKIWESLCPLRYREADRQWIQFAQPNSHKVLKWAPNKEGKGLYVYGQPDSGKTSTMFLLFREMFFKRGYRPLYITATRLGLSISAATRGSNDRVQESFSEFYYATHLFIDDIGREAITPRVREGLQEILNERADHGRPTFYTSELSPEDLFNRFDAKDQFGAESLIRRLFQSAVINFDRQLPPYQPLPQQQTMQGV